MPPAPPEDIRGLHFGRTPRPGQGTVGRTTLGLELVLISPKRPEDAQALRDWGDFVHIHDIAAASPPHFTMITPYENVTSGEPRYLHLYELDTLDPEPAFAGDDPHHEGPDRRLEHPRVRGVGVAPGARHRVRQHLPPPRRADLRAHGASLPAFFAGR